MKRNKIILSILILSMTVLILSGCGGGNPVIPSPPDEPLEPIIPETTKIVEEETIQEIVSITEDQSTIVFKKSTPQLEELTSGDIIAMGVTEDTPEGLLRKVKNIIKGAKDSSEIMVETEFVTLEEAIEQGEFNFDIPLQIKNIKEPVSGIEGVKLITDKSKLKDPSYEFNYEINLIAYDGDGNPNTLEDNIVMKGFIFFDYNILFNTMIESHKLNNFVFENVVELETDISVAVGAKISVNILGKSLLPKPIGLGTFTIMLGPIPVVLSPSFDIKWDLNVGLYGALSVGVTRTDTFTAGFEWSNGTTQPIADYDTNYSYNAPSTSLGGQVKFSIGPEVSCKIYKILGPYCDTSLYAELNADILGDPWWKLAGGVDVGVGAKLKIFTKTYLDVSLTVIDVSVSIAQADGPFGGTNHAPIISSLTANPSSVDINQTTTITCTTSDEDVGDTLTYTWTKNEGTFEGSITGATVPWRAPSTAGSYTVTCKVSDGEASDSKSLAVTVNDSGSINHSPDITSTAITSATKGQLYSYDVNATDSDGDTLTYSLTTKPSGMTINSSTGLIAWTPTTSGNYNVTVKVSDGGLFDTQSFTVTVEENGTALVPPTGLSVSSSWNTTSPGFPSMALSWNAVSGATGYDMWVRPSGGSSVSLGTRDAPYVTFNSNSLPGGARYVSGTTYYFKVCTVTASGTSGFTSEVPCVAAAAPSSSLGKVQLSSPGSGVTLPPGNITFSWNFVSNATKYEFILYNQQGQVALDTTYSSASATVALGTEETITWKVRAGDNSGNWGTWSDTWSLTLKSTTIINKPDLIVSNIWTEPNPPIAAGYTTIGIEIKNQGNADATGTLFLEFYFDGTYQGHVYINGLTAGSTNTSYWQAVTWPSDTNLHTIKGVVDPDNIVVESNENNNQYSIQVKATELPVGTGTLKIESVPGVAKVYIDGEYKGETPSSGYLTISNLAAGDHDLKVNKSGYKDWIGVVTIPSGSTKYEAVILESISTKPNPPTPLSPGSSSAPGPTIDTLTPTLTWLEVDNADYYALAISVYPYGSNNIVYNPQEVYGSSIAIPSGKLEAGKKYRWNMQSHNSAGWSEEVSSLLYFQTEPSPTSQIERLTNASFSSGTNGWTLVGDFWAGTNLSNYHTSPGYAAGGVNRAGSPKNNAVGWMYQDVSIPSGATSATLSFWYNITSEEAGSTAYDVLNVTIQNSTGNYLATVAVLSNLNKSSLGSYNKVTFDVTSYKGQTIRVHFLATTDGSVYTVFRIDDVSLMSDG